MKITKIELRDFHQFKDVTLDLTYPAGHDKAGQPLDKVCFIGQSGTGKTTLLELIPKFLYLYDTKLIEKIGGERAIFGKIKMKIQFGLEDKYESDLSFGLQRENDNHSASRLWENGKLNGQDFYGYNIRDLYKKNWTIDTASKLVYFPANLNFDIAARGELNTEKEIIDFSKDGVFVAWNTILDSIKKYQEQGIRLRQDLSKTVEQSSNDLTTIRKSLQKLDDWKENQFNPIKDVAEKCLDRLLKYFKLKVKTDWEFNIKDDIGFIKIEDYNGNEIPHGLWSTGTKQVVLSALPLYLLKPKHTVILFDEPERSLYPDLQRIIVDFYSQLTNNCQFFYSTHSPIIASSFEPWEIVELKFNEEGYIYRELYYEGENHVGNYKYNPRYMRWDDILQRVFDMADDGSPERKRKLDELATYNVKYKKLQKQNKLDTDDAKGIIHHIETLSNELSHWD